MMIDGRPQSFEVTPRTALVAAQLAPCWSADFPRNATPPILAYRVI
jgi:hypothetical protein